MMSDKVMLLFLRQGGEVLVLINLQPGKARSQDDKGQQHAGKGKQRRSW